MAFTMTLPEGYNYVLAVPFIFIPTLAIAHSLVCGHYRSAAGIPYPNSYATAEQAEKSAPAYRFNCAQRAQANFDEHAPYVALTLLAAGLGFPRVAATLGAVWGVGRAMYLWGYATAGPKARYRGGFHSIAELGLFLLSGYTVVTKFLM